MAFEHQKTRKVIKLDQLNIFHVKCVIEYFDLNQEGLAIIFSNLFVNDFMDFELHRTTSSAEFQKKKKKRDYNCSTTTNHEATQYLTIMIFR